MNFCAYGTTQTIGTGKYYICSITGYPCKFARWCSTTCEYKPNANLNSCSVRTNKIKETADSAKDIPEILEPIDNVGSDIMEDVVEELVDIPEEEPVKKSNRGRRKKASSV